MNIVTTDLQLYETLRNKIGNEDAGLLVSFIDRKVKVCNDENINVFATKEDITHVRDEIKGVEVKLKDVEVKMKDVELKIKDVELKLKDVEISLKHDLGDLGLLIHKKTSETNRWIFGIFFAMFLMLLALLLRK